MDLSFGKAALKFNFWLTIDLQEQWFLKKK